MVKTKNLLKKEQISVSSGSDGRGSTYYNLVVIPLGRALHASNIPFAAAQPAVDRPSDVFEGYIQSRNGDTLPATSFSTEQEIDKLFFDKKVIILNEFQFTSEELQDKLYLW